MVAPKKASSNNPSADYGAKDIQVLEGLDPVRKRPGMYIGSTGLAGLHHLIWEVVDNSVDEAMAGFCDRVGITILADGGCKVDDNGRGIPVDPYPSGPHKGKSAAEVVLTVLHAGGKFGGEGYKVSGGLHGVGASVVNALSERMSVEIDRNGGTYAIDFQRAVSGRFVKDVFTKGTSVEHVIKRGVKTTGTRVRFWPDFRIFQKGAEIEWDRVKARLEQTSYLIPGLRITLLEEATGETFEYHHKGGIVEMLGEMDKNPPVAGPWKVSGKGTYTETSQVIEGEELVSRDLEREIEVEVADGGQVGDEAHIGAHLGIGAQTHQIELGHEPSPGQTLHRAAFSQGKAAVTQGEGAAHAQSDRLIQAEAERCWRRCGCGLALQRLYHQTSRTRRLPRESCTALQQQRHQAEAAAQAAAQAFGSQFAGTVTADCSRTGGGMGWRC